MKLTCIPQNIVTLILILGKTSSCWSFNFKLSVPPRHHLHRHVNRLEAAAASSSTDSPHHQVVLDKPMGLILEEIDANNPEAGVQVKEIVDGAAAAEASRRNEADIAIGDKIISILGDDCRTWNFDQVMDALISASSPVRLEFERPAGTVSVKFENGVAVAVTPGEIFGNIAIKANYFKIPYDCRSGACGTCEQKLISEDGKERYIRPCIGLVPGDSSHFLVVQSDRFE